MHYHVLLSIWYRTTVRTLEPVKGQLRTNPLPHPLPPLDLKKISRLCCFLTVFQIFLKYRPTHISIPTFNIFFFFQNPRIWNQIWPKFWIRYLPVPCIWIHNTGRKVRKTRTTFNHLLPKERDRCRQSRAQAWCHPYRQIMIIIKHIKQWYFLPVPVYIKTVILFSTGTITGPKKLKQTFSWRKIMSKYKINLLTFS